MLTRRTAKNKKKNMNLLYLIFTFNICFGSFCYLMHYYYFIFSSTISGAINLNLSLNGSLLVTSVMCSIASVHPISLCSKEKTIWNSKSNICTFLASSVCQSYRLFRPPFFSNVSNNRTVSAILP